MLGGLVVLEKRCACPQAYKLIGDVIDQLREVVSKVMTQGGGGSGNGDDSVEPYNDEKITLLFGRWTKLYKDFYKEGKGFDMSKIPVRPSHRSTVR